MKITYKKAGYDDLENCKIALQQSDLGAEYFSDLNNLHVSLEKGIADDEFYIAVNEANDFIGFIWYTLNGSFHSFPYLHMIVVTNAMRGRGAGTAMLQWFEKQLAPKHTKVFLVVGDFNSKARALYEALGYVHVGSLPDLYKQGVNEYLMMKNLQAAPSIESH